MKKISIAKEMRTREQLSNPYGCMSVHQRLCKANAVNMEENCTIQEKGNGYFVIKPIDKEKIFK